MDKLDHTPPVRESSQFYGEEARRLLQFLGWVIPLVFVFGVFTCAAYFIFEDTESLLAGGILFSYGIALIVARVLVFRGRMSVSVGIICVGLLVASLLMSAVSPQWIAVLILTPLLAAAVALPYIRGRALIRLILLAWGVAVVMATFSVIVYRPTGLPIWYDQTFTIASTASGVAVVLLLLWQFSSRLNATLARTRSAEERYALVERGVNDGIWDWDIVTGRIYYSERWKEMIGDTDSTLGDSPDEWFRRLHPEDREYFRGEIDSHLEGKRGQLDAEYRILHSDGRYRWMLCRGIAIRNEDGEAVRMAGSQSDITRRKEAEERLIHNAFHDTLTGLPNRDLFQSRLHSVIQRTLRGEREDDFAVLFIDLDNFKAINDSLGHQAGDDLLVSVSERLKGSLRPDDLIARFGGDEFSILVENTPTGKEAEQVADRLLRELQRPFPQDGRDLFTTASIGIVLGSLHYEQPEDLLRDADTAMYRAKAMGRSRKGVFERNMHSSAVALFKLETELRQALERQEFVVYYQPIASLKSGRIVGFEALIRWKHPERGLLAPAEFVPVAEDTGLIQRLELFVLREACHQAALWRIRNPSHRPLNMNINLSRGQLARPELVPEMAEVIRESGLDPRALRLEITESALIHNIDYAFTTLKNLRDLDIQIHIDDFGTGYSSLSTLHNFPIDSLKIDRSFVSRMGDEDAEIVETIIALGHNLGLDVIAEGIETERQLERLREMGCDLGQGFLFSKPLDARNAGEFLLADPSW